MPVAIEVPGLDVFAPEVPDGSVLILEGGMAPAKSHLARRIARTAAQAKRPVAVLSTRSGDPAPDGATLRDVASWTAPPAGHDVIVDSFSLLSLDATPAEVADRVRGLRTSCRQKGRIAVLVLDDGQLDPAARAACHHLADGVIQFLVREDAEGPVQFLRIPKWMDKAGIDRNLFYGFDGRTILIDTRRRVN